MEGLAQNVLAGLGRARSPGADGQAGALESSWDAISPPACVQASLLPPLRESPLAERLCLLGFDGEFLGAADLSCYVLDPNFGYQEFAQCNEDQPQIFRVQVGRTWQCPGS